MICVPHTPDGVIIPLVGRLGFFYYFDLLHIALLKL